MKKNLCILGVALVATLSLSGCHGQDQNAAAFAAATKNVATVKNVIVPGSDALDKELTTLGGYPESADVSISKKATDTQYSIGYDANHHAIVAVSVAKDGTAAVVTDADLIQGYTAKIHTLTGEKSTSTASASSDSSSGPGNSGGSSSAQGGNVKGCPVKIGMNAAAAKKALHGQIDNVRDAGTDHETWVTTPIQSSTFADGAVGAISGAMGVFSLVGNSASHKVIKTTTYQICFTGGFVSKVEVFKD